MTSKKTDTTPHTPHGHRFSLPKFISHSGHKPSKKARIQFVVLGAVLALLCANAVVAATVSGRIYPGVSVAGQDLSFKTRAQAYEILKKNQKSRSITLKVGEKVYESSDAQLGASYDLSTTVDTAYQIGRSAGNLPILGIFQAQRNGQQGYAYNLDLSKLRAFTSSVVNSIGHDPVDASIVIQNGNIVPQPAKDGVRIDQRKLNEVIKTSLSDGTDQNISLSPTVQKAEIQEPDLASAQAQAQDIMSRKIVLSYDNRSFAADRVAIGHMIVFEPSYNANGKKQLTAKISTSQVAGYVQSVANQINIKPINKKVSLGNGSQTVEREGVDGLAVNQGPAIDAIASALSSNRDISLGLTAGPVAFKTETSQFGARGGLDAGSYIEVSLGSQRLWAWQGGQVIFTTPITSGAAGAGFPTVQGTFAIYAKERSRYLNGRPYGWNYNVFVDYWMPFTGGYGLHDADWRSSFGGPDYYYGGSHGCVNMPKGAAAFLFGWAGVGTPVWVHG